MKKINTILNAVILAFAGVFVGMSIGDYLHFKEHPELYAMTSAPWYTGVILYAAVTAIVIIVCCIIKFILKKKK